MASYEIEGCYKVEASEQQKHRSQPQTAERPKLGIPVKSLRTVGSQMFINSHVNPCM